MAKTFYVPVEISGQYKSKRTQAWYVPVLINGQYKSKKVLKAYCPVNGRSKLFWSGKEVTYVIYDNGAWHNIPSGTALNNYEGDFSTGFDIYNRANPNAQLTSYYLTNECLKLGRYNNDDEWAEETNDGKTYIRKTRNHLNWSGMLIPIFEMEQPKTLLIYAKSMWTYGVYTADRIGIGMVSNSSMTVLEVGVTSNGHPVADWTTLEVDISGYNHIDYIYLASAGSELGCAKIEIVTTQSKRIYSKYFVNAYVYSSGTVSKNNGSRTPVTKPNDGDGVCFISKNGLGTGWGGNWIVTCCIALSRDAALLTAPNIGNNVTSHVINGVTYWIGLQATNGSWGGGTQVENPLGLPIYDDLYICPVNASPSTARVAELIELLGIQVKS